MECGAGGVCLREQLRTAAEGQPCVDGATFCVGGLVCAGAVQSETRCTRGCITNAECGDHSACVLGEGDVWYCRPDREAASLPEDPLPQIEKEPERCAAVGGGPAGLALLFALLGLSRLGTPKRLLGLRRAR